MATIDSVCPNNHKHEPWGLVKTGASKRVFATALEVHYPTLLCEAIVHAFILRLTELGLTFLENPKAQHVARAATGEQSKALKLPPLVPNFSFKLVLMFNDNAIVWPLQPPELSACKLLHEFCVGDCVSVNQLAVESDVRKRMQVELSVWGINLALDEFSAFDFMWNRVKIFGVQWQPQEFLDLACKVQHPLNPELSLPSVLADTIDLHTSQGWHEVAKARVKFFMKWNAKVEDLKESENRLRQEMDPIVEAAVKGKRIQLFAEMLKYYDYPDQGVVDELKVGADLTGQVPETNMLPFKFTSALLTTDALGVHSSLRREHILAEPKGSGDSEVDLEVWRQTLDERDKGWLRGPLSLDEVPMNAP